VYLKTLLVNMLHSSIHAALTVSRYGVDSTAKSTQLIRNI